MSDEHEYSLEMPFWIDTEGYSDRDRMMFCCGAEFEMLRQELSRPDKVLRMIHTENESRARMMAHRFGRVAITEPSGTEGWSYFTTPTKEPT